MGLLKTGLKAVVAVKTADVIHQRILERQAAQWGPYGPPQPSGQQMTAASPMPVGAPTQTGQPHPSPAQPMGVAQPAQSHMSGEDVINQLTRLGELRANGLLTDTEFEAGKARVLAG